MPGYWVLNSEVGSYLLDYKHNFIESTLPLYTCIFDPHRPTGPVAQWITRLTTDQKIPGSNPGRIGGFDLPAHVHQTAHHTPSRLLHRGK